MTVRILVGDCRKLLAELPEKSVNCVVTSPPYWGLRDYGVEPSVWGGDPDCDHAWNARRWYTENSAAKSNGSSEAFTQAGEANAARLKEARWRSDSLCEKCGAWLGALGLEPTPEMFTDHLGEVFAAVWRVLADDGTLWLNLGDSYATGGGAVGRAPGGGDQGERFIRAGMINTQPNRMKLPGLKSKDLIGIPWRSAFALQAAGWYLRSEIIWAKPNPMPESVTDRPTKSHEHIFLMTKSERYYYDSAAIAEPASSADEMRFAGSGSIAQGESNAGRGESTRRFAKSGNKARRPASDRGVPVDTNGSSNGAVAGSVPWEGATRNKRDVWTVPVKPFSDAHFATFPTALIEPCILAGTPKGGGNSRPFRRRRHYRPCRRPAGTLCRPARTESGIRSNG